MHRVCVCLNHVCVCACVRVSAAVRIHTRTHTNITNVCRIDVRTVWQYGSTAVSQQCFIWQYGSISSPQYGSMAVSQQCLSSISTMLHMAVRQYLITTVWQYGSVSTMLEQYLNNASYGSTAVSHHHNFWQYGSVSTMLQVSQQCFSMHACMCIHMHLVYRCAHTYNKHT
jgi:hypothetical protein